MVISPSFTTEAAKSEVVENFNLPLERKVSRSRSSVVATRPAASTVAPFAKNTPLGLMRTTRPFAESEPRIADGATPVTLFAAIELMEGWTNRTLSCFPIENCSHSI